MNVPKFAALVIICEAAILLPSYFVTPNLPWYNTLVKPDNTPSAALFAPIWIILAFLAGCSLYVLHERYGWLDGPDVNFVWLIAAQVLWVIVFFGSQDVFWGFIFIISLWFSVLISIFSFARFSKKAAALLIPYLLWVTIATYFNYGLWMLNH